ncbi:hypothetical protein [Mycobacterium aquaticum]|uniref:Uncharacterized protein n=1 Tax=Mycobacterium aquaticum TaxID=1927124 RepID=A0A1X0A489_9MYCO|nr:hypothetical protein [Mycobacterium aquaticum]ORA24893.1 hypothetical protein BST13_33530 [Mycobacterium aquaticum]
MSAAKAGTYVLVASAFHRIEGDGDDAVRRRYKRGDKVALSKSEAARLAVPTYIGGRAVPAPFAKAADVPPGDDLAAGLPVDGPIVTVGDPVVGGGGGANLAEGQAIPGVNGDAGQASGAELGDGRPAKSATLDVWKAYAVKVGAVTEEQAGEMTKSQLQEAVARPHDSTSE